MKTQLLSVLLVLLGFTAFSQDKDEQADYDWAQYDFAPHFTLKSGGGHKIFAENKRIFIANFQVSQIIVANGKQTGQANLAKMTIGLTPIDIQAYQASVDKMYQQLVEKLKAEGYTIVSDEEVAATEFAKDTHNGKSVFAMYYKEPSYYKDMNGNEVVNIFPTNKFFIANYGTVLGNWPSKMGKALNANVLSIVMTVSPVSFDGSRGRGKKGASIEARANMTVSTYGLLSNERGGFGVWTSPVDAKDNWVGPKGLTKTDSSTDFFGSVRGSYVLDVNQDVYLSEVEAVAGGISKGFVKALMKELK